MFDQAKKKTAKIPLKLLNELLITMQKGCLCVCGAIPTYYEYFKIFWWWNEKWYGKDN